MVTVVGPPCWDTHVVGVKVVDAGGTMYSNTPKEAMRGQ